MRNALDVLLENQGKLAIRSLGEPHKKAYKKEMGRKECNGLECFNDLPLSP